MLANLSTKVEKSFDRFENINQFSTFDVMITGRIHDIHFNIKEKTLRGASPERSFFYGFMLEMFSFSQAKQRSQIKKSLIKSKIRYVSLGSNDLRGVNLPVTDARFKKIVLVIISSKTVSYLKDRFLEVLSFRFLYTQLY